MKKILICVAGIICTISIVFILISAAIVASARKSIDLDLDEALFEKAGEDRTIYYYAYDTDGELVEVHKSSSDTIREWVALDQISENVKMGFIAMEDREFYKHNGVNFKRTFTAILNHLFKYKSSFGASTITQQVIKNISGDNENSISRKAKEILRAINLEKHHSKDEIFELYLNVIPMTGNIYGVSAAAEIYFGKEAKNLSIAEAATIVGITNAPAKYNPYTKAEYCVDKRNRVLYAMHSLGYIDDSEYREALNTPLELRNNSNNFGVSSWFIETANTDIIRDICATYSLSKGAARLMLNGAKVILTMNPDIQKILEDYFSEPKNLSYKFNEGLNYAMVISNPKNGNLMGIIGNGGRKNAEKLFNHATALVTPGSVIKPLALYAPLIENGDIVWSTMVDDSPVEYVGSDNVPYPKNTPDKYDGMIDINEALKRSKNTVAIRLFNMLGAEQVFKHLYNDYGFDTLVKNAKKSNGETVSDMSAAPLALGQLTYGISLRSLTEGYNVFPSGGVLSKGRSYSAIYDVNGKIIIENRESSKRLYSEETTQVMNQLLSNVVSDGTARQISLKELIDVAGKTGTSGNDRDRLFIGYTPFVTAGIWCGFDSSDKAVGHNTPSHLNIWDEVMERIHDKLVLNSYDEDPFTFSTDKLVVAPYCSHSGLKPCEWCELDDESTVKFGYYKPTAFPSYECEYHKHCLQNEDLVL